MPVSDLTALASPTLSKSLKELSFWRISATDFSPVAACRSLEVFESPDTAFSDLEVLRGLKLRRLRLNSTKVTDISPLAGMPLEVLLLTYTPVRDLSPLLECPTLKSLVLPNKSADVAVLRQLPALVNLGTEEQAGDKVERAEDFWKRYEEPEWLKSLRGTGVRVDSSKLANGTWDLRFSDPVFSDLTLLKGAPVSRLNLSKTAVTDLSLLSSLALEQLDIRENRISDLSPLRTAPLCDSLKELLLWKTNVTDFSPVAACKNLEVFDASDTALDSLDVVRDRKLRVLRIGRTKVSDISALAGMPLEEVYLGGSSVTDLGPLLKCQTLKSLVLPAKALNVAALRSLPALVALSYESVSGGAPKLKAAQFWKDYDSKQK
jgi:Leucine-rich repeat (LRR) protein